MKNTNSSLLGNIRASEITDPAPFKRKSVFFYAEPESISADVKSSDVNTQAVEMDSGVQFSLSNFIEDILLPTSSKMSPTSNLGL